MEILGERFQHVNLVLGEAKNKKAALMEFGNKLPDIDNAINVDYVSSNFLSGKKCVTGVSGNLSASRTIVSHAKEDSSVKLALQDIWG